MSWYSEDKKMRERTIGALSSLCKSHGYELDQEDLKKLKRMKFAELHEFSSKLMTQLGQRQHEVTHEVLDRANEALDQWLRALGRGAR